MNKLITVLVLISATSFAQYSFLSKPDDNGQQDKSILNRAYQDRFRSSSLALPDSTPRQAPRYRYNPAPRPRYSEPIKYQEPKRESIFSIFRRGRQPTTVTTTPDGYRIDTPGKHPSTVTETPDGFILREQGKHPVHIQRR